MPPVLITGGGGFTGRYLRQFLEEAGEEVVTAGHGEQVEEALDFRDEAATLALFRQVKPSLVYHFASTSCEAEFYQDPTGGNHNVIRPAINVMEAAARESSGARVVLASSFHVVGRPKKLPIEENASIMPAELFGSAKGAVEYMSRTYQERGLDVVIVRAFPYTGPGQDRRFLLADWALQARRGVREIPVGNLELRRDYSDVRDIVAGYSLLGRKASAGVYNLCSGKAVSLRECFERICGPEIRAVEDPSRIKKGELPVLVGSAAAAEKLGWVRQYCLEDTLAALKKEE
jgi:nucleoside-diphosphate-sugar epimerase